MADFIERAKCLSDTHACHVNHLLLGISLQDCPLCFDAQNERILTEAEPATYRLCMLSQP